MYSPLGALLNLTSRTSSGATASLLERGAIGSGTTIADAAHESGGVLTELQLNH